MSQTTPVEKIDLNAPVSKEEMLQMVSIVTNITTALGEDGEAKTLIINQLRGFSKRLIDGK